MDSRCANDPPCDGTPRPEARDHLETPQAYEPVTVAGTHLPSAEDGSVELLLSSAKEVAGQCLTCLGEGVRKKPGKMNKPPGARVSFRRLPINFWLNSSLAQPNTTSSSPESGHSLRPGIPQRMSHPLFDNWALS